MKSVRFILPFSSADQTTLVTLQWSPPSAHRWLEQAAGRRLLPHSDKAGKQECQYECQHGQHQQNVAPPGSLVGVPAEDQGKGSDHHCRGHSQHESSASDGEQGNEVGVVAVLPWRLGATCKANTAKVFNFGVLTKPSLKHIDAGV